MGYSCAFNSATIQQRREIEVSSLTLNLYKPAFKKSIPCSKPPNSMNRDSWFFPCRLFQIDLSTPYKVQQNSVLENYYKTATRGSFLLNYR